MINLSRLFKEGKYVFYYRHTLFYVRFGQNGRNDPLFAMRRFDAVYRKNGNEFHHALFHHPDDPDQRQKENDRMPELQGAVSDGMKKLLKFHKSRIAVLFMLVFFSSCVFDNKPELIIVDEYHQMILSQSIDPVTEKYDLPKLREFSLYRNDLEVRVWVSFLEGKDGFIFRRFNRQWSAVAIKDIDCNKFNYWKRDRKYSVGKINLHEPESGWQNVWQKLLEAEILDLPDYSELPEYDMGYLHGIAYFVEINKDGKYRTYAYSNPQVQMLKEAEQMMKISEIISDEFNLHNFEIGSLCIEK